MQPDRVEKYEILEEIGHGGMATVYRARDTRLERPVALKLMHPHLRGSKEARTRFAREARTVARLRHANILEIYDYSGEESRESFIATELLTGPTLKAFAQAHPDMPAEIAACFTVAIAQALAAAHAAGVVHRDVKPENVLIHEQRTVKLTDFGIAQLADAQSMTSTGEVLGSPGHMAPEQVEGKECDPRSDVFSVGTVLYMLATGSLPFTGSNPHQVLKKIVEGQVIDPLRIRPAIGGRLAAVIMRCLAVDPARRYASAAALEEELRALLIEVGVDRPLETLQAYLADPDGTAARLRSQVLACLLAVGKAAQARGDRPKAMDCFNRVLALDEGNAEVLALLQRLGRRTRLRQGAVALGGVALLASVGLAWQHGASGGGEVAGARSPAASQDSASPVAVAVRPLSEPEREAAASASRQSPPGEASEEAAPDPAGQRMPGAPLSPDADDPRRAGPHAPDAEPARGAPDTSRRAESDPAQGAKATRSGARGRRHSGSGAASPPVPDSDAQDAGPGDEGLPRRVVFQPTPANVSIAVDDGPLKPFGPSFREVELSPGLHRFRIVGARECCADQEFELEIPAGPGTTTIARRLALRPAGLYVVSNVPANVSLDGGDIRGRTRSVMRVPAEESLSEHHRITVAAPGYRPATRDVTLRAGRIETVEVHLEPTGEEP